MFHTLNAIQDCLNQIGANTLTSIDEWAKLYYFLCLKHDISIDDRPMLPRSFADLVYKTKLMFHSMHTLRFAMIEGQKRTFATALFLVGHVPSPTLQCHYTLSPDKYEVDNIGMLTHDSDLAMVTDLANRSLDKMKFDVQPNLSEIVRKKGKGLSPEIMNLIREYSRRLADQHNKTQNRGWKTVLGNLLGKQSVRDVCFPYELYKENTVKPLNTSQGKWVEDYRHEILEQILVDKNSADINQCFSAELKSDLEKLDIAAIKKKYTDSNIRELFHTSINLKYPPKDNRLIYIIMTLVTTCVTDFKSADMLEKTLACEGKPPSDVVIHPSMLCDPSEFPDPANYDIEVSLNYP